LFHVTELDGRLSQKYLKNELLDVTAASKFYKMAILIVKIILNIIPTKVFLGTHNFTQAYKGSS
jgi:hypothetical protein